jgi:hypothetical protein
MTYPNTNPNPSTVWDHNVVDTTFDGTPNNTPTAFSFPYPQTADNVQSASQLSLGVESFRTYEDPALAYVRQAGSAYTNNVHNPFQLSLQTGSLMTHDDPALLYVHQHGSEFATLESPYSTTDGNTTVDNIINPQQFSPAADTPLTYTTPPTTTFLLPTAHANTPTPCPYPRCAATFNRPTDLPRHYQSIHLGIRHHCFVPSCHNNHGNGYCRPEKLKKHQREKHRFQI